MDRVSLIVAAIAAGAAGAPNNGAAQEVEAAYGGLKALLQRNYPDMSLEPLEAKPASRAKRDSLAEDLVDSSAGDDDELLAQAHVLLEAVLRAAPGAGAKVGIDLAEVNTAFLTARNDTRPAPDRLMRLLKTLPARFWEFWKTLPGVLTGVAALITAIVGLLTLLHVPGPPGIPWPFVLSPAGTNVSIQGQRSMGADDEVDLERGIVGTYISDRDFWLTDDDFYSRRLIASGSSFLAQIQGPADEQKCTARLKVRHDDRLYLSRLKVGDWICISTSHGQVAALRVDRLAETPSEPDRFDFTFITWKWTLRLPPLITLRSPVPR